MVIFKKNDLRLSLLTPCLLRVEKGAFTDEKTQMVVCREWEEPFYTLEEAPGLCTIRTQEAIFRLDPASGEMRSVTPNDGPTVTDFEKGNLLGTARTLDQANGPVKLEKGIQSRYGVSMMADQSLLVQEDGTVATRKAGIDRYYFAYGRDYSRQLKDFYRLTGRTPLIPKFALGNWWSRYKAYTQEEYRDLMQKFMDRKIPITVATIDIDWHWTDVVDRFGKDARPEKPKTAEEILYNTMFPGWTGYSWNKELFPDHRALLDWLHEKGFRVTLNVHPAQGIRFFEDPYEAVCRRMGKDPAKKECVTFDMTDPAFQEAYFEEVHRPMEEEGVDFWWIDWQQGKKTKMPGLDPLWALNHYHSLDMEAQGKRPLILSRYAGLGSHRYPLGFSGDTHMTWASLDFQPYFTNTAANAGYTWWSHDIGGHMLGVQDDELYLRWLQYGVFSPVNRLHSSNSDFMGKEPWKRSWAVEKIAEDFLRLRHRLIPYLYSANYRTHAEGEPICSPMYYRYDREEAYEAKNQYIFGGQLMVCPITAPADKQLNLAKTKVWLPDGRWTDLFTGRAYQGGRWVWMHRDLDSIPVLAPAGAIVPMYQKGDSNDLSLEQPLEIHIWRGNGAFELYEDDGQSLQYRNGKFAITKVTLEEQGDTLRLTVTPPAESFGLLPEKRTMILNFRDVQVEPVTIEVGNKPVTVTLKHVRGRKQENKEALKSAILTRVQGSNQWKNLQFGKHYPGFVRDALEELEAME